jgi:hypothetical protein
MNHFGGDSGYSMVRSAQMYALADRFLRIWPTPTDVIL